MLRTYIYILRIYYVCIYTYMIYLKHLCMGCIFDFVFKAEKPRPHFLSGRYGAYVLLVYISVLLVY